MLAGKIVSTCKPITFKTALCTRHNATGHLPRKRSNETKQSVRYGAPSNAPLAVFAGGFMADDVDTGDLPRPILKTFLKASPLIYTEPRG